MVTLIIKLNIQVENVLSGRDHVVAAHYVAYPA